MDRLTRKELKQDKFALEVEQTFDFLTEHRREAIRYGVAAAILLALILGLVTYRRHQYAARQAALTAALGIQNAQVGSASGNPYMQTFPTQAAKDKAAIQAFTEITSKYSGSDEAAIAHYYLGSIAADQARNAEAEKEFRQVIDSGNDNYASLAKMSLADLYAAEGKISDAESLLRSLIQKPTVFVSKDEATIELATILGPTKPAEARKMLEPLRTERSAVSRAAITALGQIPSK